MNESQQELFEQQLITIASGIEYPRTPDVAGAVMRRVSKEKGERGGGRRRLAWSLMVVVIMCSSLMLIPPARAAILEFIEIGAVRIFRSEPASPAPPQQFPATMVPVTATPPATSAPLIPLLEEMAGETRLEEAERFVPYAILLPTYPPDLGPPDRLFVQDADGPMSILVWVDPEEPEHVLMSLHFLPPDSWAVKKIEPQLIQETSVGGRHAIWAVGPYPVRYSSGEIDFVRMVQGHVLIWTDGVMTYRLETDLSLEEAVRIAESLEPFR